MTRERDSFTFAVPDQVYSKQFSQTIREVRRYDELTVGSAREHETALRKVVQFGSGSLVVVAQQEFREQPTQPETLFDKF